MEFRDVEPTATYTVRRGGQTAVSTSERQPADRVIRRWLDPGRSKVKRSTVREPSEADIETPNRLIQETAIADRRSPGPVVVPAILESGRTEDGEALPFAPGGNSFTPAAEQRNPLAELVAGFRWRRPLMFLLVAAVAGSVALAARRSTPFEDASRTSGAMAANGSGDGGNVTGLAAPNGDVASEAPAGSEAGSSSQGENADGANEADEGATPAGRDAAPLHVTATTALSSTRSAQAAGTLGRSAYRPTTTLGSGSGVISSPASDAAPNETSSQPSSTIRSTTTAARQNTAKQATTARPAATERTTTQRTTTFQQTTTAEPSTTTPPVTSVILVGNSGGFDEPPISEEMIWLENGEVGRWRSTNGDIQLMRSGFEGIESVDGGQFAEVNSSSQAGLYRDLTVEPGTVVEWRLLHRAREGSEKMEVQIGPRSKLETVEKVNGSTRWVAYNGRWTVPEGVTSVRFMLWSKESGAYGNLVDGVWIEAVGS